jgi:UDP-N-acetylmuramate--alanine ligase
MNKLNDQIPLLFGYESKEKPIVHFIGVGGIGLSSLAQWFLSQNWQVSGSDVSFNENILYLKKLGLKFKLGHKNSHINSKIKLVIYSQAIPQNNPEIIEAKRKNIPLKSYPGVVGYLTNIYKTIAIAGAHGKSTTTALTSLMLLNYDLDPTVIIGTKLKEFNNTNFKKGKGKYLVLEADEYGGAFWNYFPAFVIITNIDNEHLDFYKNFKNIQKSFLKFLNNVKFGGVVILNKDSKELYKFKKEIEKIAKLKNLNVIWYSLKDKDALKIKKVIQIPGEHNVSNALAVLNLGKALKIPEAQILHSISKYKGSWRRMEYKGKFNLNLKAKNIDIFLYDDYAHHPTEIKFTLSAFYNKYPRSPIICVFEPHQSKRLKELFRDFTDSFSNADIIFILPIHKVLGRDKNEKKFNSKNLVKAILKKYPKKLVFYIDEYNKIKPKLKKVLEPIDFKEFKNPNEAILIMMGAGNIYKYTPKILNSKFKM